MITREKGDGGQARGNEEREKREDLERDREQREDRDGEKRERDKRELRWQFEEEEEHHHLLLLVVQLPQGTAVLLQYISSPTRFCRTCAAVKY